MIQNTEIGVEEGETVNIALPRGVLNDADNYWFSYDRLGALFKMSKTSWNPEYVACLTDEDKSSTIGLLRRKMIRIDSTIYYAPSKADSIVTYSLSENKFNRIAIAKNGKCTDCSGYRSLGVIAHEKTIYFTPSYFPAIIQLDTQTNTISFHSDWVEPLTKRNGYVKDAFFADPLLIDGNRFLLASYGTNAVVEFNMDTHISTIHEVGKKGNRYRSICFDGNCYWLSPRHNSPVVKWNPNTGEVKEFANLYLDSDDKQFCFCSAVYCSGYIWLLPYYAKHAVKIDVNTDEVSIAEEFEIETQETQKIQAPQKSQQIFKYYFTQILDGNIFTYDATKRCLVEYNPRTNTIRKERIQLSCDTINALRNKFVELYLQSPEIKNELDCLYFERGLYGLTSYTDFLVHMMDSDEALKLTSKKIEIARKTNVPADGTAGKAIYRYVKNIVCGRGKYEYGTNIRRRCGTKDEHASETQAIS
jgi:hypothetical protein